MSPSTPHFVVDVATSEADLADACEVREQAYRHHLKDAAAGFSNIEALDRVGSQSLVLVCRDPATGRAVGTARVQTNALKPLLIERSVILPHHIAACARAEVTRLAVLPGAHPMVKLYLMKAVYLYCQARGINWLVICARSESLRRQYRALGFQDFLPRGAMVPMAHAGQLPHFVFTMNLDETRQQWQQQGHRLHIFMFETTHLDLPRFDSASSPLAPRHHKTA
ncbi:MAG: hypothetical protein ACM3VZ_04485 [Acidobacteriota bacterium]